VRNVARTVNYDKGSSLMEEQKKNKYASLVNNTDHDESTALDRSIVEL